MVDNLGINFAADDMGRLRFIDQIISAAGLLLLLLIAQSLIIGIVLILRKCRNSWIVRCKMIRSGMTSILLIRFEMMMIRDVTDVILSKARSKFCTKSIGCIVVDLAEIFRYDKIGIWSLIFSSTISMIFTWKKVRVKWVCKFNILIHDYFLVYVQGWPYLLARY